MTPTVRRPLLTLHADELVVDNFAGGGGASTGIAWALGRDPDIAINHDHQALALYRANHPNTRILCEDIFDVKPRFLCGRKKVGLAWFSPDCTFFSRARGARPHRDRNRARRRRGLAGVVLKWAEQVRPRVICVENVPEFKQWGPLGADGQPDPTKRGTSFARWRSRLLNLGYAVELRELRACDFGAPTSRKRLFIVARCDGQAIAWPQPSHGPGRAERFRTAADCIDWNIPCPSIFGRKKPLAEATLKRIARGIRRYVIESASPFIVPTVDGDASPVLIQQGWGERKGQAPRCLDIHKPIGVLVGGGIKHAVVNAFLARHYGGHENDGAPMQLPLPTITTRDHHAVVTSHLLKLYGSCVDGQPIDEPAPTIRAQGTHLAEVRAFLVAYYGSDQNPQLGLPLPTITTKHRFALVTIHGVDYVIVDIGMRMLSARELFLAQGFPASYVINPFIPGNRKPKRLPKTAQVLMCGNSVSPYQSEAVVLAQFAATAEREAVA